MSDGEDVGLFVANLDEQTSEPLLYELFTQFAPVQSVRLPKDKVTRKHQGFGFVQFNTSKDAVYAMKITDGLRIYGRPMRVKRRGKDGADGADGGPVHGSSSGDSSDLGVSEEDFGPVVYVGNLDGLVDEKTLAQTFKSFGKMRRVPRITRQTGSEGKKDRAFALLYYETFEAGDRAIKQMQGKMVTNRPVVIEYAYKQGSKTERHGDAVERLLYEKAKENHFGEAEQKVLMEEINGGKRGEKRGEKRHRQQNKRHNQGPTQGQKNKKRKS